jgi:hypothetical protein
MGWPSFREDIEERLASLGERMKRLPRDLLGWAGSVNLPYLAQGIVLCRECGAKVRPKNLAKHLNKVHGVAPSTKDNQVSKPRARKRKDKTITQEEIDAVKRKLYAPAYGYFRAAKKAKRKKHHAKTRKKQA